MKKRFLAVLLLAVLLAMSMAQAAWAATVASGECGAEGDNVTWVLDDAGTLTISGTGEMADFEIWNRPWIGSFDGDAYNYSIKKVIINNGVTTVGENAFIRCNGLTEVILPDSLNYIGKSAFSVCFNLVDCSIPDNVVSIDENAFWLCRALDEINIPTSVKNIGLEAFCDCDSLRKVYLSANVFVGDGAFAGCDNLMEIIVDNNNKDFCSENGVLFNKDKTILMQYPAGKKDSYYKIPNTVNKIGWLAFNDCTNLEKIDIPSSIRYIYNMTFINCSALTALDIPEGVEQIGEDAFSDCISLNSITFPKSLTLI